MTFAFSGMPAVARNVFRSGIASGTSTPLRRTTIFSAGNPDAASSATSCGEVAMNFRDPRRSEEHTSELQSHSDLVCRLLLEKKKSESICHNETDYHTGP